MAFGLIASAICGGTSTTSGTSLTTGVWGAAVAAGSLVVVQIAKNNIQTTDGETSEVTSVTDTAGNTYSKAKEFCNGQGAAAGGAVVSLWYSVTTVALTTSDTVTANFSAAITARAMRAQGFTKGASTTINTLGTGTLANDAADPGSMTSSGLSSGTEYMTWRATASETNSTTWTTTASPAFNSAGNTGTASGGSAANMRICGEYLIASGNTSVTSNPTQSSADHASVIVSFYEVSSTPASFPAYRPGAAMQPFLAR